MRSLVALSITCTLAFQALAADPCVSGLTAGQRPGPYTFVVSTGKNRGQLTCYICETGAKPAVIVFARSASDQLGKFAAQLDAAVAQNKEASLCGWVTFLSDDQPKLDPQLVMWSQKHAIKSLPVGVFEDAGGPPAYRLSRDADVTVLLFVKQKVAANFAFRSGELNDEAAAEVLKSLTKILPEKQ